jgi:hypothetical protein
MTVTLGSELREALEGLGGALVTWREGFKLEDMERVRRCDDVDDFGDGDPELRPSRSLECRPPDGGLTSFEKKPGAIIHSPLLSPTAAVSHSSLKRRSRLTQLEI